MASANLRSRRMPYCPPFGIRQPAVGRRQSATRTTDIISDLAILRLPNLPPADDARLPTPGTSPLALQLVGEELIHRRLGQREPLRLLGAELGPGLIDRLELGVLGRFLLIERGGRG